MIYGYCRISTNKQNIERQVRNILEIYPTAKIIKEVYTGTKQEERKEFKKLLKDAKEGDTIVFDSVSRMSRNAENGFSLYKDLFSKGINLVFLKEPHINTDTYKSAISNKMPQIDMSISDKDTFNLVRKMFDAIEDYILSLAEKQIRLAFEQAEKEVEDLHKRTSEGIKTAKLNGKQIGHQEGTKLTTKKSIEAKQIIRKHNKDFGGCLTNEETWRLANIAKMTFYKYKAEIIEELEQAEAQN